MTTPIIDRKKRARKNINLLEKADEIALSHLSKKVLKPEYRKVLTNQDEQLKYYLSTYKIKPWYRKKAFLACKKV